MRLLFIRHGEPDYRTDSLTPKGKIEAELLSRRMAAYQIRDFFVSPLGRAQETAEYTLKRMNRTAETLPWLQEFRGRITDPITGRSRVSWDLLPRVWTADPLLMDPEQWVNASMYQGSNVPEIWEETRRGIDELMARYGYRKEGPVWTAEKNTHDTLAFFCHFAISMVTIGYLMNFSPVPLLQNTLFMPSSVTEIVTEERVRGEVIFRMTKGGDLTHLESAGQPRSMAGLFPECYTGIDSTDQLTNGATVLLP